MKLTKDCINAVYNFIIENTSFIDEDITKLIDCDSNTFCPQPISIHKIIKECSAFSSEEIKSALCLLDQSDIIKINTNYNGKLDKVVITKNGYFEILKRFL